MELDTIHCGDCRCMDEVDAASVDLIISGPPYWDYIDYSAHACDAPDAPGPRKNGRSYEQFLADLSAWYCECFRVLRSGRYCVVNVGSIRREGRCYPIPFHTVGVLERVGFEFCFEIIWHKVAGGRRDARLTLRKPYPGSYLPNNRTEYLLVFRKHPQAPFLPAGSVHQLADRFGTGEVLTREIANNVWHILPAGYSARTGHPCPFPPEIPLRLIRLFSCRGELVLDPFMGVGTTARAARMLGRHFLGYELEEEFVRKALRALHQPLRERSPILPEFSSQPRRRRS